MTHGLIVTLAALGVLGLVLAAVLLLIGLLWLLGLRLPLRTLRLQIWGYELWLAFLVAAVATGGSLFFSEVAHFVPCELCWFQRICMYPLSITTLLMALADDHRAARYLLPLPVVGAGISTYHLLVENGAVKQTQACLVSAPGGCATKWINEFGFVTIPTLALTAFALVFAALLLSTFEPGESRSGGGDNLVSLPWLEMPSGKQSKRQRRAIRTAPPPVRTKGRQRRASPRVLRIATAIVVLAAIGLTLGIAFSGGSSKAAVPARGSLVNALPGAGDAQRLLQGIPQRGNVLGSRSAPVTLVEYVDLQCPFCKQFETQAMPALIGRYVRTGKVKIEARPIAFIGADSQRGRVAAIAAGEQNKLFNFAQILFLNQGSENTGWLNDQMVTSAAASIPGLDVSRLLAGSSSDAVKAKAGAFDRQAVADNVRATPTILVGKSGGALRPVALTSPSDEQPVASAINAALRS